MAFRILNVEQLGAVKQRVRFLLVFQQRRVLVLVVDSPATLLILVLTLNLQRPLMAGRFAFGFRQARFRDAARRVEIDERAGRQVVVNG